MITGRKGSANVRVCRLLSGGTSIQVGIGEHDSEKSLLHNLISSVTSVMVLSPVKFALYNHVCYELTFWSRFQVELFAQLAFFVVDSEAEIPVRQV